jgi:hypothetical protein
MSTESPDRSSIDKPDGFHMNARRKLKDYNGDVSKLGPAERFLEALVNIPLAFERFDAMRYRENFREEVSYIRESYETLEA